MDLSLGLGLVHLPAIHHSREGAAKSETESAAERERNESVSGNGSGRNENGGETKTWTDAESNGNAKNVRLQNAVAPVTVTAVRQQTLPRPAVDRPKNRQANAVAHTIWRRTEYVLNAKLRMKNITIS
jgi:hypothetical protein